MDACAAAPVAVAVLDADVDSSLRFAAREALLRGCSIQVVGPGSPTRRDLVPGVLSRGRQVAEVLTGPGVPVQVHPLPVEEARDVGKQLGAVEAVLAACPDAGLVVIHRSYSLYLLRALSYGQVGGRARVPVACVPPDWSPEPDDSRPVVVALRDVFHPSDAALLAGLEQARAHRTWLRVVHAWNPTIRLDPEEHRSLASLWTRELDHRIRSRLEELTEDVPFVIDVREGVAADVVLEAAAGAQLLLLSRRSIPGRVGSVGRTTRTAVRESPCPVILVPSGAARPASASATDRDPLHRSEPLPSV